MIENKKILYLYTGDHPVHRKFASAITKDYLPLSEKIPKEYDIYFVEGDYAGIIKLKKLGKLGKNSKIIVLFSDPRLYYLNSNKKFDVKKDKIVRSSKIKKFFAKKIIKELDGVICVGEFEKKLFSNLNLNIPTEIVTPFIDKTLYKKLIKIKPNLSNKNILFIGNGPDYYYKGIDILVDVFKEIKKFYPLSNLSIIGNWKIKENWKFGGISFQGTQKNISKYLKENSLYLHLGRGEAYGITILEAMLSGIPCIISNLTGAREEVKKASSNFVVPLEKEKILIQIKKYFNSTLKEKNNLSRKFREVAQEFKEKEKVEKFRKLFNHLLTEVYKNEN